MAFILIVISLIVFPASGQASCQSVDIVEDSLSIPIVDFEGLQPWLTRSNDTTYVVNFWATWCVPCVKELPYFETLEAKSDVQPVKVILVSLDFKNQIKTKLIPFVQQRNLQSEVVVLDDPDANSWIDKISPAWSGAIPATLVYRNDERTFYERSFKTYDELFEIVKPYINL
jgi:thiol-disulfide isomerase/thioredoxin